MRTGWTVLLAGLIVWAAHFLGIYLVGEFAGERGWQSVAIIALTLLALIANGAVARYALRLPRLDGFDRWRRSTMLGGAGLSGIAVVWQALPAII